MVIHIVGQETVFEPGTHKLPFTLQLPHNQ